MIPLFGQERKRPMTPIDAMFLLMVVVPVAFVFARFGIPWITWKLIWILTPIASWLIVNVALWLSPPDNGFTTTVQILLGWLWMLPVMVALWLLQAFIVYFAPRLPATPSFQRTSRVGLYVTAAIAAMLLLYGMFGWISSERAIQVATRQLTRMGHPPQTQPHATWSSYHWTVRFGNAEGPFIDVSRNGDLLGGGGG